jgi:hypothetical protein
MDSANDAASVAWNPGRQSFPPRSNEGVGEGGFRSSPRRVISV